MHFSMSVPLPAALQHYAGTASQSRFPGCSSPSPGSFPGSSGTSELPAAETCCDSPTDGWNSILNYTFKCKALLIPHIPNFQISKTHPLEVEEVFFEGLSGLSLLTLVDYVRVFFVTAALIVFTAVSLPVTKTHPAEVFQENQTHIYGL